MIPIKLKLIIVGLLKFPLIGWIRNFSLLLFYSLKFKKTIVKYGVIIKKSNLGEYVTINENSTIVNSKIGDMSYLASNCKVVNTEIGKYCSIGPNCISVLGKHPVNTFVSSHPAFFSYNNSSISKTFSDKSYYNEVGQVKIGNDVWIGANVLILDDITIGNGAIIAAGSVVVKDVENYTVVGGVPAKLIRHRFDNETIKLLLNSEWWNMELEKIKNNYMEFQSIERFKKYIS